MSISRKREFPSILDHRRQVLSTAHTHTAAGSGTARPHQTDSDRAQTDQLQLTRVQRAD